MSICIVLELPKMFVDKIMNNSSAELKRSLASTSMSHFCLKNLRFEETILHMLDIYGQ